jgi:hypothetical protein
MKQEEINAMIDQCFNEPDSKLARFVMNPDSSAQDMLRFLNWVDENTEVFEGDFGWVRVMKDDIISEPQSYDMLLQKYLSL